MAAVRFRSWTVGWLAAWVVVGGSELTLGRLAPTAWVHPAVLFALVLVAASLCVVTSGLVVLRAWRSGVAEAAALGTFFMSVSLLPLAHGLTVPGIIYGPNTATAAAVYWAVPVGSLLMWPTFFPRRRWANRVMTAWRPLVLAALAAQTVLFAAVLARPDWLPAPPAGTAVAALAVAPIVAFCGLLSFRHLRLGWLARSKGPLAVSVSAVFLAASNLVFVARGPWTPAFWLAHGLDATGVLAGTVIAAATYRRSGTAALLMAPIDAITPLRAIEVGLDPLVGRFVADLERKDPITRNHVVRTAHMAAAVAEELRLSFDQVRVVALGGLLHDIGKLQVPDHILNKAGALEPAEYEIVKRHPVDGERLVLGAPALADLAPVIRGHHERVDGRGYPDGRAGGDIPIGARIVAACDAYDAIANTRQYRAGAGQEKALTVLAEHTGTQWDYRVVAAVTRVVRARAGAFDDDAFTDVGHDHQIGDQPAWCGCAEALPAKLAVAS
ncbi:MAG: HD domain-containing protein [Actinomycetota bacterium]|nr:HD domain-containing protein [Actinomycetota bacterium]